MTYLYIFIGGGLGSLLRFLIGKLAVRVTRTDFPAGTLITNILACGLLAILVVYAQHREEQNTWLQPLLIVGFCGGFSTFSTFGHETQVLLGSGNIAYAIANVMISVIVGVGLIYFLKLRF